MPDPIKPTAVDRAAASDVEAIRYANTCDGRAAIRLLADAIRAGEQDEHPTVQAFALHARQAREQALEAIANLPTPNNLDIMEGHEQAYRVVESLFKIKS